MMDGSEPQQTTPRDRAIQLLNIVLAVVEEERRASREQKAANKLAA
jgi:hypothetical protein